MYSQLAEHWESFRVTALVKYWTGLRKKDPNKYSTVNSNDQIVQKGFMNDLSSYEKENNGRNRLMRYIFIKMKFSLILKIIIYRF